MSGTYTTKRGYTVRFGKYGWHYEPKNPGEYSRDEVEEIWKEWSRFWGYGLK